MAREGRIFVFGSEGGPDVEVCEVGMEREDDGEFFEDVVGASVVEAELHRVEKESWLREDLEHGADGRGTAHGEADLPPRLLARSLQQKRCEVRLRILVPVVGSLGAPSGFQLKGGEEESWKWGEAGAAEVIRGSLIRARRKSDVDIDLLQIDEDGEALHEFGGGEVYGKAVVLLPFQHSKRCR